MDIKNDMEHLVQREVRRRREAAERKSRECWCDLCVADIEALALNLLPPRYCKRESYGMAAAQGLGARVEQAVNRALEKVSLRPKHRPGIPLGSVRNVRVVNFAFEIGSMVADATGTAGDVCRCDLCRADSLAFALNRYPPKYGVEWGGRPTQQEMFRDFIRHELGELFTTAARVVGTNPNH